MAATGRSEGRMTEPAVGGAATPLGPLARAYSGQVMGAVVDAFGTGNAFLKGKTARRFFAGHTCTDANRRQVFEAVAGLLLDAGGIETSNLPRRGDLARALEEAALRWDEALATLQSRAGPLDAAVMERGLRFAVVDLALRLFALLRLARRLSPRPGIPLWSDPNGGGELLRRLARGSGLTREALAERVGVSDNTVDAWLDGASRPSAANVAALAEALESDRESAALATSIRWTYALSALATGLAHELGREQVRELASALVRFVRALGHDVERMDRPPIEETAGAELNALWHGAAHSMSHPLLRNLAAAEEDPGWRRDILASMRPWGMGLQHAAVQAAGKPLAAGLAEAPAESGGSEEDANAEAALGLVVAGTDPWSVDLARQADRLRSIARRNPGSARAHFEAGAFLGMAGKRLGRRDLVDEGIVECWIAARLAPGWDAPAVEPGVILANAGQFAAALEELWQAEAWLGRTTPHLLLCRGYARMRLSLHDDALADLEAVIAERPDFGLALEWAARCALAAGQKRRAHALRRQAMRYGAPDAYLEWWLRRDSGRGGGRTRRRRTR